MPCIVKQQVTLIIHSFIHIPQCDSILNCMSTLVGLCSFWYNIRQSVPNTVTCLLSVAPHPVTMHSVPTAAGELGRHTDWTYVLNVSGVPSRIIAMSFSQQYSYFSCSVVVTPVNFCSVVISSKASCKHYVV